MGDAVLYISIGVLDLVRSDEDGALYLPRIAPYLLAPFVEDPALAGRLLGVPEAVPDVGVLRHDAQGNLLAAAPDQDRYPLAHRRRVQPG